VLGPVGRRAGRRNARVDDENVGRIGRIRNLFVLFK
jgi:hypothetical protein